MTRLSRRRFLASSTLAAGSLCLGVPAQATGEVIEIGAILPLSGDLAVFGRQARLGLELAAKEINDGGGLRDREVVILYEDDKGDPELGAAAAQRLVARQHVLAIAGPITSASRDAMADTVAAAQIPLLYATDYEGGDCGRYWFYFSTVPNQNAVPLITYLNRDIGQRFYLVGADYAWPRGLFDVAEATVEAEGGAMLGKLFVPLTGDVDFAPVVEAVAAAGADVVVLALPGAKHWGFVDAADRAGLLGTFALADLGGLATYLDKDRRQYTTPLYGCVPFVETDPGVQDFVEAVRAIGGDDTVVTSYAMTHYGAMTALRTVLEEGSAVSREGIAGGLPGLTYALPTGQAEIGSNTHHCALPMFIARIDDGSIEVVEPLGTVPAEPGCLVLPN